MLSYMNLKDLELRSLDPTLEIKNQNKIGKIIFKYSTNR